MSLPLPRNSPSATPVVVAAPNPAWAGHNLCPLPPVISANRRDDSSTDAARGAYTAAANAKEVIGEVPFSAGNNQLHAHVSKALGMNNSGAPSDEYGSPVASPAFEPPKVPLMVLALLVSTAFVQSFSSSAIGLLLNMDMKLGPVEVTRYWMYISCTAWTQPLLGYLSDAVILFGEKRRPLFVLSAAGNVCIFAAYAFSPWATASFGTFVVLSLLSQLCTMGLYIPLNGLVVEVGRRDAETTEESTTRMSAIMSSTMAWRSVGSLLAYVLQTFLVLRGSTSFLLSVTALLLIMLILMIICTPRALFLRPSTRRDNFYVRIVEAGTMLRRSFDRKDIRSDGFCFVLVLLFVFSYTMMPDAGSVYYNYLYGAFSFPKWFYVFNNCASALGSIAGAYSFSSWMDRRARQEAAGGARTSLFFLFLAGSVAWAFGYVTNLLLVTGFVTSTLRIPANVYVPVDSFVVSMFVRFAYMPTIAMAAEHAPKYFEATTFEIFSVASIAGGTLSSLFTSNLAKDLGISRNDYSRLWILICFCILFKLLPIPFAYLLPERHTSAEQQQLREEVTVEGDETRSTMQGTGRGNFSLDWEGLPDREKDETPHLPPRIPQAMDEEGRRMLHDDEDEGENGPMALLTGSSRSSR